MPMEDRFFSEEDRITEDRMDFRMIHIPPPDREGEADRLQPLLFLLNGENAHA